MWGVRDELAAKTLEVVSVISAQYGGQALSVPRPAHLTAAPTGGGSGTGDGTDPAFGAAMRRLAAAKPRR